MGDHHLGNHQMGNYHPVERRLVNRRLVGCRFVNPQHGDIKDVRQDMETSSPFSEEQDGPVRGGQGQKCKIP
jgi:hypothetical protein